MSKSYCPFLYGKFRKYFRVAAIAVTLTAAACAGSSDEQTEPVAVEEGESSEAMANDEGSGLIIEQENPDEAGNDVPLLVEDAGMEPSDSQEIATSEAEPVSDDTDAVPEEIMTSSVESETEAPESLDSTLDNGDAMNDAVAAQPEQSSSFEEPSQELAQDSMGSEEPSSMDSPSMASNMGNFGQSSGVLPPGVIASPGAAIFIKSKYEQSPSSSSASAAASGGSYTYVVVPGDTISGISRKIYGSFDHWKKLASWNSVSAPYYIQPGDVIKYEADTAKAKSFASGYTSKGMKTVKVRNGDTLSKLAEELYGNTGAWKVLYNMNKGKISNPNHIHAGMVLSYEGGGSVKQVAAKKTKAVLKKTVAKPAVQQPVEEPKVEEPKVEEQVVSEPEAEAPVAEATEEQVQEPAATESDEMINVDLPTETEE